MQITVWHSLRRGFYAPIGTAPLLTNVRQNPNPANAVCGEIQGPRPGILFKRLAAPILFDSAEPGLVLRVTSAGHKSWSVVYRVNGATPTLKFFDIGDALEQYIAMKKAFVVDLTGDPTLPDRLPALLEIGEEFAERVQHLLENAIASSDRASRLYRAALRIAIERNAVAKGLIGRRPAVRI